MQNLVSGGGGTGTNPRKASRSKAAFFLPSSNGGSHSGSGRSNSPRDDYDEIEQESVCGSCCGLAVPLAEM